MELVIVLALIGGGLWLYSQREPLGEALPEGRAEEQVATLGEALPEGRAEEQVATLEAARLAANQATALHAEAMGEQSALQARVLDLQKQLEQLRRDRAAQDVQDPRRGNLGDAGAIDATSNVRAQYETEMARLRTELAAANERANQTRSASENARLAYEEAGAERAKRLEALLPRRGALEASIERLGVERDNHRTAFNAIARMRLVLVGRFPNYAWAMGWELANPEGTATLPHTQKRVVAINSTEGQGIVFWRNRSPAEDYAPDVLLVTPEEQTIMRQLADLTRDGQDRYDRWQVAERAIQEQTEELARVNAELATGTTQRETPQGGAVVLLDTEKAGESLTPKSTGTGSTKGTGVRAVRRGVVALRR